MDKLPERNTEEAERNECLSLKPYECFRKYPPGQYRRKDFLGPPHPSNVVSFKSGDNSVLVSLNYGPAVPPLRARKIDEPFEQRLFNLKGYCVHVWSTRSPIVSVEESVTSVDDISDKIEELKAAVEFACHHENSEPLPQRWHMVHKFRCLDCKKEWGYDSSG